MKSKTQNNKGLPFSPLIVVIEDEQDFSLALKRQLPRLGYNVKIFASSEEAANEPDLLNASCILLDVFLPGRNGIEALSSLRKHSFCPPVIVITDHGSIEVAIEAMKCGAWDFLQKPIKFDVLNFSIKRAVEHHFLNQCLNQMQQQATGNDFTVFEGMVGSSPQMQRIFREIKLYAPTESPVLIIGETGTGKELVARAVHTHSKQAQGALVALNMGGMLEGLIGSELFGHERGAFTGAIHERKGCFELAKGGTIFLDEISNLPLQGQAKLLRVLETGEYKRIGSERQLQTDARIIAATNHRLEELVRKGQFREDLLFRLNALQLQLPPLRERLDDLPELIVYYVNHFCRKLGRKPPTFYPTVLAALRSYNWPGNIRELRHSIEHLLLTNPGDSIQNWFPPHLISNNFSQEKISLRDKVKALEVSEIRQALASSRGNTSTAAKKLGLPRPTLIDKMKKYRIQPTARIQEK
ncbi:MAG: sigma-54-dependent Fis family transcriptional regulator [Candidatus Riflebacteria bacterium]|nr:sigma-54-dependent Fis family transcriptional regulator [Candidatus Riflebacteria bacterium]